MPFATRYCLLGPPLESVVQRLVSLHHIYATAPPTSATVELVFFASGVKHESVVNLPLYLVTGTMMIYFLLQAVGCWWSCATVVLDSGLI